MGWFKEPLFLGNVNISEVELLGKDVLVTVAVRDRNAVLVPLRVFMISSTCL